MINKGLDRELIMLEDFEKLDINKKKETIENLFRAKEITTFHFIDFQAKDTNTFQVKDEVIF